MSMKHNKRLRKALFRRYKFAAFMYYIGAIKLIEERKNQIKYIEYSYSLKYRLWYPFTFLLLIVSMAVNALGVCKETFLDARLERHITTLCKIKD